MRGLLAGAALLLAAPVAAQSYKANCQICHRADGAGQTGQFPRLAGRVGAIAAKPEGRAYLITVLLSGMAGRIVIAGQPIVGVMPAYARLSDADIAAALTHAASLGGGKAKPFTVAEVKAARLAPRLTASQVKALRDRLVADGTVS